MNLNQHLPKLPNLPILPNVSHIQGAKVIFNQSDSRYKWGPYYERSGNNGNQCMVHIVEPFPRGFPFTEEFIVGIEKNSRVVRFNCKLPDLWEHYIKYKQLYPAPRNPGSSSANYSHWQQQIQQWQNDYDAIENVLDCYFEHVVQRFCK